MPLLRRLQLVTFLKSAGLIGCLAVVAVAETVMHALAWDGCTKYVPRAAVEMLNESVWETWAVAFAINAIILLVFLSNFLTRIRLLASRPVLAAFACFVVSEIIWLASIVKHMSKCGEARDFVYPEKLTWLNADFLFFGSITAWFVMIFVAVYAVGQAAPLGADKTVTQTK